MTWVAIATVAVAEVSFLALLQPPTSVVYVSLFAAGMAVVAWPVTMALSGTLKRLQLTATISNPVTERRRKEIAGALQTLDNPLSHGQFETLTASRDTLADILTQRIAAGEEDLRRHVDANDHLYLLAVESYEWILTHDGTDATYARSRLDALGNNSDPAAKEERVALNARLDLHSERNEQIAGLLAGVEASITTIDHTIAVLDKAPGQREWSNSGDDARDALNELIERANLVADALRELDDKTAPLDQ